MKRQSTQENHYLPNSSDEKFYENSENEDGCEDKENSSPNSKFSAVIKKPFGEVKLISKSQNERAPLTDISQSFCTPEIVL